MEKNKHLVDTLVSHFRGFSKGHDPFSEWNKKEVQGSVGGDEPMAMRYMQTVGAEVRERSGSFSIPYRKETV